PKLREQVEAIEQTISGGGLTKAEDASAQATQKALGRALHEMLEIAEKGPNLPGDLKINEVDAMLEKLNREAHPDTHKYVRRIRAVLDNIGDQLVARGLITEAARRRDYFPHKVIEFINEFGQGRGKPGRAKSQQFRGYTKLARSNRRLVDTNVTSVVLDYATQVARHNALDDWYRTEIPRYAVKRTGKKAVPLEGEFTSKERVAIREGNFGDRTDALYRRLPEYLRELEGMQQGIRVEPTTKDKQRVLKAWVEEGGYAEVSPVWGVRVLHQAESSKKVRELLDALRKEGVPIPDAPMVGRFRKGGRLRIPAILAKRIEELQKHPDIYPAETWFNRLNTAFKRNVTVTWGGFSYFLRNFTSDFLTGIRDDADPEVRRLAGSITRWLPVADTIGRWKEVNQKIGFERSPKVKAELRKKLVKLEAKINKFHPEALDAARKAYELGAIGTGFTAEEAGRGQFRVGATAGLERFSGLEGERAWRQVTDKVLTPIRHFADLMSKANERREDLLRTAKFVRDMVGGMTPRQAFTLNGQTFINYGQLTEFERRWLSRGLLPFWTWTKNNPIRWTRGMRYRPKRTLAYLGVTTGLTTLWNTMLFEDEEDRLQNSPFTRHIAEKPHIFLPFNDSRGNPMVITLDEPFADALGVVGLDKAPQMMRRIASGDSPWAVFQDGVKNAVLSPIEKVNELTTPFVKALIEAESGRDLFTDKRYLTGEEEGFERLTKAGLRVLEGYHRGFAEVQRARRRAERTSTEEAFFRSSFHPASPFVRFPSVAGAPTTEEAIAVRKAKNELLDAGHAVPGDREGEIRVKRGVSRLPFVRERQKIIRQAEVGSRMRRILTLAESGEKERAAEVVGDWRRFRSLMTSNVPLDVRRRFTAELRKAGFTLASLARHRPTVGR
ncbi:MAG: hypothetical protein ACYTKD_29510, partial [Planctomycetota bacterium]